MHRIDPYRLLLDERCGGVELFASEAVHVDRASIEEVIAFLAVNDTIDNLSNIGFLPTGSHIERMIYTPDFHKVSGIPVGTVFRSHGFVMPRAVGSDIGCGMRFMTTDVTREEFNSLGDDLDKRLRYIFFEGGRNIPLSRFQREMIFSVGLHGLCEMPHSSDGIWPYWEAMHPREDADLAHGYGGFDTGDTIFPMTDFIKGSGAEFTHDDQIGSVGGGNHFCEFQVVEETYDRHEAYFWGIKPGMIAIMCHSGSLGIGHLIGNHYTDLARDLYPAGLRHEHDFYVLPEDRAAEYMNAMSNAANFAIVNRMFLGLMMVRALSEALGRKVEHKMVYDAPHNLVWPSQGGYLHRKGACPADESEPVIIPGSMGSSSYIMAGLGNELSLCSACHGAGRTKARQQGRKNAVENLCRVVTKIDPKRVRQSIRDEHMRALAEESPDKYKPIDPIIETIEGAGIAHRVARTFPLLTVKGL